VPAPGCLPSDMRNASVHSLRGYPWQSCEHSVQSEFDNGNGDDTVGEFPRGASRVEWVRQPRSRSSAALPNVREWSGIRQRYRGRPRSQGRAKA
jgi:hypothetical protein